jgi:anthranilate phosphoribosyltransferase
MSTPRWPEVLSALLAGLDLSVEQAGWAMEEILSGEATQAQIAGFVIALRAKGESVDEVEGLVQTMYDHAATIDVPGRTLDVVGTGGDRSSTVNLSTMAAIVAAGAGALVVKHGNRAASSACGSADLLEALGISLQTPPDAVAAIAAEVGITFCFAPVFHPALRHAAVPRRELGVATTFNFLGPLANPSRPAAQAVGVADVRMAPILAGVLARRGVDAMVFRGDDGLDELTTTTTSTVWEVRGDEVVQDRIDPAELGLQSAAPAALRGGDAAHNAAVARRLLAGERGPVRDAVVLNAGAALAVHAAQDGSLVSRIAAGMARAAEAIDSGAAETTLRRWMEVCEQVSRSPRD